MIHIMRQLMLLKSLQQLMLIKSQALAHCSYSGPKSKDIRVTLSFDLPNKKTKKKIH